MAIASYKNPENAEIVLENVISLKKFPLNVRKVAKYMLENEAPLMQKKACEDVGVNYASFRAQVAKYRHKGIDFQQFIDEQSHNYLRQEKMAINKSLVIGAVLGSHNHQKLYYQLTGDLKETTINTSITLAIGMNVTAVTPADQDRDKGVIDVEPVIPSKS